MSSWQRFTQHAIDTFAPSTAGVYEIAPDSDAISIYVGRSTDIHDRLSRHVSGKSRQSNCIWTHKPRWFRYEKIPLRANRLRREQALRTELSPLCDRVARSF